MRSGLRLVSLREEGLERKLALAFGFMSFIPILIVVWARFYQLQLDLALYLISASALIGYFLVARRMIRAVLGVARKAKEVAEGGTYQRIEVAEHDEIGELARAFNRITHDLEQKIEQLESSRRLVKRLLSRIGSAIISYEGIDKLLDLIVENTTEAMEAQMGCLMLVDGEKQELSIKTAWSSDGQPPDTKLRIKLGADVAGWVAREGRPLRGHGRTASLGFTDRGTEEGALLSVPLQIREHAIGVVTVFREAGSGRAFSDDDETLLTSIGSQIAVAIENYRLNLDVERTYLETIMALALAVEARDPYSAGHSKRVGHYASELAEAMGLDQELQRTLHDAGILHDIGKIGIKDDILLKPGPLTADEQKIMQQHCVIGEAIVKPVRLLSKVVALVKHHHERYDGTGYPSGLKGEGIPLGARILAVADAYDAMITDRPYRKRLTLEETKAELTRNAGRQHDPAVVEALVHLLEEKEQRLSAAREASSPPGSTSS